MDRRPGLGSRAVVPTLIAAVMLTGPAIVRAASVPVSEDVPVPGGTAAVARALAIEPVPDRARFAAEITRLLYDIPEGKNTATDLRLRRLSTFLASIRATEKAGPEAAELVPVPLTTAIWAKAIFHRPIAADGLFVAILGDRRAALLCHGLSALDDETLQFLAEHPALLTRLYERDAAVFAAFGGSVRVHDGRMVPSGGELAVPLWEAALGEHADQPERFIHQLFERGDGRVAYLYDTLTELEPSKVRFALGLWIKDAGVRLDRFKALVTATSSAYSEWRVRALPFARPLNDMATLLARVRVDESGVPALASRPLWARAFDALDVYGQLKHDDDGGLIDAAWLAFAIGGRDVQVRSMRADQFAFGQRVFAAAPDPAQPDVLVALRAFPQCRMLMLTLERVGITAPSVYAAAAHQARRLASLESNRGFAALAQFQGALALLTRMARVRAIDAATAQTLVSSLVALPLRDDGRYAGAVARWLTEALLPALAPADDAEGALLAALAGRRAAAGGAATMVVWEGQQYRLDLAGAELRRLRRVRERQGGYSIDAALTLDRAARILACDGVTVDEIHKTVATLKTMAGELAPRAKSRTDPPPPGIDAPKDVRDGLDRVVKELSKIDAPRDAPKSAHAAEALDDLAEAALVEALLSLAYAVDIGEADGSALLASNVARRHDFGFGPRDADARARIAWGLPRPELVPGVPWHVSGSLLGLDVGLAPLVLRRTDTDRVVSAPTLTSNERETFATSVALMNPFDLRDEDRDAIWAAVARGRQRVAALTAGAFETVAAEIGMDGWRRRALQWTLVHEPALAPSMFSMTELLHLGGGPASAALDAWGMTAVASTGCLCVRLVPPARWTLWTGRPQLGLVGASVADLNLHVAVMLHDLQLPAALARHVLAAAVQDFVDEVRPTDPNDWLTLVRSAQQVSRERIEDYLAAATADGPLLPEASHGAASHQP